MKYESAKTPKGNIGVSYVSQDAADAQAAQMDASGCMYCANCAGCTNCTNCAGCTNCVNCTNCTECTECTECMNCAYGTGCTYCAYCTGCTYCANCAGCTNCTNCLDCTDCSDCNGVLGWCGPSAKRLFVMNGLRWPVAISETHMQIGCENHSHEDWRTFTDSEIGQMAPGAIGFWKQWKPTLMAACAWKAGGGK